MCCCAAFAIFGFSGVNVNTSSETMPALNALTFPKEVYVESPTLALIDRLCRASLVCALILQMLYHGRHLKAVNVDGGGNAQVLEPGRGCDPGEFVDCEVALNALEELPYCNQSSDPYNYTKLRCSFLTSSFINSVSEFTENGAYVPSVSCTHTSFLQNDLTMATEQPTALLANVNVSWLEICEYEAEIERYWVALTHNGDFMDKRKAFARNKNLKNLASDLVSAFRRNTKGYYYDDANYMKEVAPAKSFPVKSGKRMSADVVPARKHLVGEIDESTNSLLSDEGVTPSMSRPQHTANSNLENFLQQRTRLVVEDEGSVLLERQSTTARHSRRTSLKHSDALQISSSAQPTAPSKLRVDVQQWDQHGGEYFLKRLWRDEIQLKSLLKLAHITLDAPMYDIPTRLRDEQDASKIPQRWCGAKVFVSVEYSNYEKWLGLKVTPFSTNDPWYRYKVSGIPDLDCKFHFPPFVNAVRYKGDQRTMHIVNGISIEIQVYGTVYQWDWWALSISISIFITAIAAYVVVLEYTLSFVMPWYWKVKYEQFADN